MPFQSQRPTRSGFAVPQELDGGREKNQAARTRRLRSNGRSARFTDSAGFRSLPAPPPFRHPGTAATGSSGRRDSPGFASRSSSGSGCQSMASRLVRTSISDSEPSATSEPAMNQLRPRWRKPRPQSRFPSFPPGESTAPFAPDARISPPPPAGGRRRFGRTLRPQDFARELHTDR